MQPIGLFGGTFNPVHFGHLRTAMEVKEAFDLGRVVFIPSCLPPHKGLADIAAAGDRLEMTRLALAGCEDFTASDIETSRSGPSYTVDTVARFLSGWSGEAAVYFIVGMDAFMEIDTWKSYKTLFDMVSFIVMSRPSQEGGGAGPVPADAEAFVKTRISEGYQFRDSVFVHDARRPIHILDVTLLDISSTRIRKLIRRKKAIRYLTPDPVIDYIEHRGLYQ